MGERGGNPFADAKWDEAWKTFEVDATEWERIRNGLREEAHCWLQALGSPRDVTDVELSGMVASIAHLAYHLGAIRQIDKDARGPKEERSSANHRFALSTGRYLHDSQSCQSSGVVVVRHILEQLDREIEKLHEEAPLAA